MKNKVKYSWRKRNCIFLKSLFLFFKIMFDVLFKFFSWIKDGFIVFCVLLVEALFNCIMISFFWLRRELSFCNREFILCFLFCSFFSLFCSCCLFFFSVEFVVIVVVFILGLFCFFIKLVFWKLVICMLCILFSIFGRMWFLLN